MLLAHRLRLDHRQGVFSGGFSWAGWIRSTISGISMICGATVLAAMTIRMTPMWAPMTMPAGRRGGQWWGGRGVAHEFQLENRPAVRQNPLARWRLACWLWEREIYNGEKLLGQDQLVFAGHAQQVALPGMLDLDRRSALQQVMAPECASVGRGANWPGSGRGGLVWLFMILKLNENGSHYFVNENDCQQYFGLVRMVYAMASLLPESP